MKQVLFITTSLGCEKNAKSEILSKILIFGNFEEIRIDVKNILILENKTETDNIKIIEYLGNEGLRFKHCHNIYPLFLFKASYKHDDLQRNKVKNKKQELNFKDHNYKNESVNLQNDSGIERFNGELEVNHSVEADSSVFKIENNDLKIKNDDPEKLFLKKEDLKNYVLKRLVEFVKIIKLEPGTTYRIIFKQRFSSIISNEQVLELANYLKDLKVSLKKYDYFLMIQGVKNYFMINMLKNGNYNFNSIKN
ncbi:hypothetical protein DMUE_1606 [Dictyocoela muelleri]|nr:hypothetical protein DMUE_1606 [Dictyocoela muelleri]